MQTLVKVQIPQALPTIMAGVNQTIMMAMSMVVTCALIGANGLGMEILLATNRVEMSKALFPGICIVIVAVILDRLTQALVKKSEVGQDG
ncbi:Glycine betaine/proline betaine transport system permease protein ProW [bioreactor metagenome]|uniref:Glycine betaine/proline betaine transport system permease protein ProW n=1 Tax=bioreactor metagenome TaxID=1076179 RepID=A0A645A4R9_9ZZZZ